MGVLNKLLDVMKLGDDEYEDEYFDDDEYEEDEYEEKPKRNIFRKERSSASMDDEDEFEMRRSSKAENKVTPMRQPSSRKSFQPMEVCVIKPKTADDNRAIVDLLLDGHTVILNLEGIDVDIAQNLTDFTLGATYALNGKFKQVSNFIFIITPSNVDISGDLDEVLGSSLEEQLYQSRY